MERDQADNASFLQDMEDDSDKKDIVSSSKKNPSEKFDVFSIHDMKKSFFACGDIFWQKNSGKLTKILDAGAIIEKSHLDKFKGKTLLIERVSDVKTIESVVMKFSSFSKALDEQSRIENREKILRWFGGVFWHGNNNASLLDLVKIGEKSFYNFDEKITNELKNTGHTLFIRSSLVASLSSYILLILGYTDPKFLKDIYNLCFIFDYAFDQESFTFTLNKATEAERYAPGDGIVQLIVGEDSGPELDTFMHHIFSGVQKAKLNLSKFFYDEGIFKLILRHHERINGQGFPYEIKEHEMSEIEQVIIFLNNSITYNTLDFKQNDGVGFFKKTIDYFSENQKTYVLSDKIKYNIKNSLENIFVDKETA